MNCPTCGHITVENLTFHGLEVNVPTRSVTRDGQPVRLTHREFEALVYLMQNPDKPLTRTDICKGAWGLGYEGLTNCVDVYVRYLREKIDIGRSPLIQTVRGIGYMLAKQTQC